MQLYEKLFSEGIISGESYRKLKEKDTGLFSLSFELKTLLYAGVLMLAGGLGIAIYNNIDTIGHLFIIILIAAISAGSFTYCLRHARPYSNERTGSPNVFYDYILLLAGLTLISFIGYLQYQYTVFGSIDGLTFLIPAIILFASAYYFDHLGVLTMAITSFCAFAGISVSPLQLLENSNFSTNALIYTGIILGALFFAAGRMTDTGNIKKHFSYTYYNFSAHLLFVFTLSGLFDINIFIFSLIMATTIFLFVRYAISTHSFYFMLISVLYGFIGLTYLIFRILFEMGLEVLGIYGGFVYLILSSVFIIKFLKDYRNKLRANDHI